MLNPSKLQGKVVFGAKPLAVPVVSAPATSRRVSARHQLASSPSSVVPSSRSANSNRIVSASATFGGPTTTYGHVDKTGKPLDIVFVSAEVAPWSKTGGLGDVVGGLPLELVKRGHRVLSVAPRYDQYEDGWDTAVTVNIDGETVRYFHTVQKGVHRVFVDHAWFLAKVWGKTGSKLYGPKSGADYLDNHKRFSLFNKAAIEAARALPFGPGEDAIFVANDWHSSLVPVLIRDHYQPKGQFTNARTALVIHNIAFQGRMWEEAWPDLNLPPASKSKFAFSDGYSKVYTEATPLDEDESTLPTGRSYAKLNWLKAGILSADKLLTVSPNYASEVTSGPAGGVELDSYIRQAGGIEGIVNGMDIEEWNPKTDKYLTLHYDEKTVAAGKAAAKEALQAELGLPVAPNTPLFTFIGRLEEQKGVDILLKALPSIANNSTDVQIVILGTGKVSMEKELAEVSKKFKNFKGVVKFSTPLAHMLTAGADFILVPSRFEPCGLIQLHAMHYGTIPLAASTGGLVDTVKEGVTGFQMGRFDADSLLDEDVEAIAATVERAAQVYSTPLFQEMVHNCINQDLSWAQPAKKWEGVLEALASGSSPSEVAAGEAKAASVPIPVSASIGQSSSISRASGYVSGQPRTPAKAPPSEGAAATPGAPTGAPAAAPRSGIQAPISPVYAAKVGAPSRASGSAGGGLAPTPASAAPKVAPGGPPAVSSPAAVPKVESPSPPVSPVSNGTSNSNGNGTSANRAGSPYKSTSYGSR